MGKLELGKLIRISTGVHKLEIRKVGKVVRVIKDGKLISVSKVSKAGKARLRGK